MHFPHPIFATTLYAIALTVGTALALTGCNFFTPDPGDQTRVAQVESLATQMVDLRGTATVNAAQFNLTLEYVQTAVRSVDTQSTRIASTLLARGTLAIDTGSINPNIGFPTTAPQIAPTQPGSSGLVQPIVTMEGGSASSANVPIAPPAATLQPIAPAATALAPPPSGSTLANFTVSATVSADDCADSPTSQFTTASESIYVVATGYNLTTLNQIASSWRRDGSSIVDYQFNPPGAVNGACVWFYITPEAVDFIAGNWSVEWSLDGVAIGTVSFTITGGALDAAMPGG